MSIITGGLATERLTKKSIKLVAVAIFTNGTAVEGESVTRRIPAGGQSPVIGAGCFEAGKGGYGAVFAP